MRYGTLIIGSLDQNYIEQISDLYDIDYYDAEVYVNENINTASLTNQIIDYILTTAVDNLDIPDDLKEYLKSKIYLNCLDSGFDLSSEDVEDMIDGTNEEKKIIKEFLDL